MAGIHCAAAAATATTISLPPSTNQSPTHRKPLILLSSIRPQFPSKITARRNYLRQKLLKTLKKPYPNHLIPDSPPTNPVIPVESPHDPAPESFAAEETHQSDTPELQTSETSPGAVKSVFGRFSTRSVLKVGLYLVGAYLFQAIVTVWIFGLDDDDDRYAKSSGFNGNGKAKSGSRLLNGSSNLFSGQLGVKSDENAELGVSDLGDKIVQIQEMARDARRNELLESKKNSSNNGVVVKSGIEKEVDTKLVKVRTNLDKSSPNSAIFPVNYLRKDTTVKNGVDGDSLESNDMNDPLVFKKKYKFRTPVGNAGDKPKGFQGSKEDSSKGRKGSSDIEHGLKRNRSTDESTGALLDDVQRLDQPIGSSKKPSKGKFNSTQSSRTKFGKEREKTARTKGYGVARAEPDSGATQEAGQEITPIFDGSGTVRRAIDSKQAAGGVGSENSDDEPNFWWLSLPYVLAIFMRRGDEDERLNGLFTVKKGYSSYTVAFEDRGDATNFCYLLESFFEDLGDFGADIVPLTNKELNEAVTSRTMKMLVVKKGQLKLYAGQPLTEVEVALRSLIES